MGNCGASLSFAMVSEGVLLLCVFGQYRRVKVLCIDQGKRCMCGVPIPSEILHGLCKSNNRFVNRVSLVCLYCR